ncbi:MAG: c-type cytochrome [Pseudomonadota bacterium]
MRNTLLVAALFVAGLSACGQKEETAQTEATPAPAPAPEAPAPAPAAEAPAAEAAAPAAGDAAAGAAKFAASCASCHGAKGQGMGTFPKLAGLSADLFKSRMADYKAGRQVGPQSAVMMPIASMLSDAEVDNLAAHIASLK